MTGSEWYYAQNGQQLGPVDLTVLRNLVASGAVTANDLVWQAGMPTWVSIASVPELFANYNQAPAGGFAPPASPYAIPSAWPTQPQIGYYAPIPGPVQYGGFWLRFVASLVDGILMAIVGAAVNAILSFLVSLTLKSQGVSRYQVDMANLVAQQIVGTVIGWLYFAFMESSAMQATYGKRLLGLQVTDELGGRISFGRATGRHFAKWISNLTLCIGYIMAGTTERKQALHDKIASCLVVKRPV